MSSNKQKFNWKYPIIITLITFFIAAALAAYSQTVMAELEAFFFAFLLLIIIISIGIVFDIVGVAVAAANPAPLHAKASRKIAGATIALNLLRNADRVSNICNDVIGDICGTLSGSIGAAIALLLVFAENSAIWLPTALMSGIVAALTVGGKAFGKSFAIKKADKIIFAVGRLVYGIKYVFTFSFIKKR